MNDVGVRALERFPYRVQGLLLNIFEVAVHHFLHFVEIKTTYPILEVLTSLILGDCYVLVREGLERFLGGLYLSKEPVLILS